MMLSNQHTLKIILMIVITVTIVIIIIIGPDQTNENSPKTNITVLGIVVTAGTTTNEVGARIASLAAL